jgi:Glycosyl hydrolase family 1
LLLRGGLPTGNVVELFHASIFIQAKSISVSEFAPLRYSSELHERQAPLQYSSEFHERQVPAGAPTLAEQSWKSTFCESVRGGPWAQWADGYGKDFGIVYVDRNDGYKRYPKDSAYFLANLFGTG